ncbi:MAG: phosphate ABC transporter substrate-binding protein [Treponema sp.]|jgi:phosphate transport system substrate-binding protein|nr:phosphate ABC transporter substrate-binding protein [Treponema sp.]
MMKKILFVLSVMVLTAGIAFAKGGDEKESTAPAAAPYTIAIGGSTSVNPLMELLIADYKKAHSNVNFTVSATGSGDGIKGAAVGTYEIGMSSRELTPAEIGTGLENLIIAIDGIAVILNNANPVASLSTDQIKDIYTGKITNWEQLGASANGKKGGIAVVSREPGSGTRGAFEELLKFQDQLVKGAIEFDGTGAIKAEVSRNADAIGYISLGSLDSTIKPLNVGGIAPTTSNVVNGSYKIARPFILVTKKGAPLNAETKAFVDWIMGSAGQAIVRKSWIPVK